jgi:hypothetical protein
MIRRRVSLVLLAFLAVVLGLAVAGTPNTGQSPPVNDVNPTQDTPAPLIDTLPTQGLPGLETSAGPIRVSPTSMPARSAQ